MHRIIAFLTPWLCYTLSALPTYAQAPPQAVSQIIAHRGASAERPENTLSALRRAARVGATATEVDVRLSADGQLVCLHDATLDRTTNGQGDLSAWPLAQLQKLDAGSWFDPRYKRQKIPTLAEALSTCRGRIDILLDLKEQGDEYARQVIAEVRRHGDPAGTIVGVRSVSQARFFRQHLPEARQLGLIPGPDAIEDFIDAGVETIRLWPRWLNDTGLTGRVKSAGAMLHLNGTDGLTEEVRQLLVHQPNSLSSDDPGQLVRTLKSLAHPRDP